MSTGAESIWTTKPPGDSEYKVSPSGLMSASKDEPSQITKVVGASSSGVFVFVASVSATGLPLVPPSSIPPACPTTPPLNPAEDQLKNNTNIAATTTEDQSVYKHNTQQQNSPSQLDAAAAAPKVAEKCENDTKLGEFCGGVGDHLPETQQPAPGGGKPSGAVFLYSEQPTACVSSPTTVQPPTQAHPQFSTAKPTNCFSAKPTQHKTNSKSKPTELGDYLPETGTADPCSGSPPTGATSPCSGAGITDGDSLKMDRKGQIDHFEVGAQMPDEQCSTPGPEKMPEPTVPATHLHGGGKPTGLVLLCPQQQTPCVTSPSTQQPQPKSNSQFSAAKQPSKLSQTEKQQKIGANTNQTELGAQMPETPSENPCYGSSQPGATSPDCSAGADKSAKQKTGETDDRNLGAQMPGAKSGKLGAGGQQTDVKVPQFLCEHEPASERSSTNSLAEICDQPPGAELQKGQSMCSFCFDPHKDSECPVYEQQYGTSPPSGGGGALTENPLDLSALLPPSLLLLLVDPENEIECNMGRETDDSSGDETEYEQTEEEEAPPPRAQIGGSFAHFGRALTPNVAKLNKRAFKKAQPPPARQFNHNYVPAAFGGGPMQVQQYSVTPPPGCSYQQQDMQQQHQGLLPSRPPPGFVQSDTDGAAAMYQQQQNMLMLAAPNVRTSALQVQHAAANANNRQHKKKKLRTYAAGTQLGPISAYRSPSTILYEDKCAENNELKKQHTETFRKLVIAEERAKNGRQPDNTPVLPVHQPAPFYQQHIQPPTVQQQLPPSPTSVPMPNAATYVQQQPQQLATIVPYSQPPNVAFANPGHNISMQQQQHANFSQYQQNQPNYYAHPSGPNNNMFMQQPQQPTSNNLPGNTAYYAPSQQYMDPAGNHLPYIPPMDSRSRLTPQQNVFLAERMKVLQRLGVPTFTGEANKKPDLEQFFRDFERQTMAVGITSEGERAQLVYGFLGQTPKDRYAGFSPWQTETYTEIKKAFRLALGVTKNNQMLCTELAGFKQQPGEEPSQVHQRLMTLMGSMMATMDDEHKQLIMAQYLINAMPPNIRREAAFTKIGETANEVLAWWEQQYRAHLVFDPPQQQNTFSGGSSNSAAPQQPQQLLALSDRWPAKPNVPASSAVTAPSFQQQQPKTCYNCRQPGHMSRECPNPPTKSPTVCAYCQKLHHTAEQCRKRIRDQEGAQALATHAINMPGCNLTAKIKTPANIYNLCSNCFGYHRDNECTQMVEHRYDLGTPPPENATAELQYSTQTEYALKTLAEAAQKDKTVAKLQTDNASLKYKLAQMEAKIRELEDKSQQQQAIVNKQASVSELIPPKLIAMEQQLKAQLLQVEQAQTTMDKLSSELLSKLAKFEKPLSAFSEVSQPPEVDPVVEKSPKGDPVMDKPEAEADTETSTACSEDEDDHLFDMHTELLNQCMLAALEREFMLFQPEKQQSTPAKAAKIETVLQKQDKHDAPSSNTTEQLLNKSSDESKPELPQPNSTMIQQKSQTPKLTDTEHLRHDAYVNALLATQQLWEGICKEPMKKPRPPEIRSSQCAFTHPAVLARLAAQEGVAPAPKEL